MRYTQKYVKKRENTIKLQDTITDVKCFFHKNTKNKKDKKFQSLDYYSFIEFIV